MLYMSQQNINNSLNKATSKFFSMNEINSKGNIGQMVLAILFVVYLIMDYKTPEPIAGFVDSMPGKITVILIALSLFVFTNPLLAVIGLFVAYELILRSSKSTGTYALAHYLPTEKKKASNLTVYNQFPYTLEQEVVQKMAPLCKSNPLHNPTFIPDNDNTYDAAPVDYKSVV
jgi:hypothetical protein